MKQPTSGMATTRERSWRFTPSIQDLVYEADFFEANQNLGFSLIRYNLMTGRQEILRLGLEFDDGSVGSGFVQISDKVDRGSQDPTLFLNDSHLLY